MKVKEVNRTVRFDTRKESSSYRCKYGKKEDFDVLKINVIYNGKITEAYEIESKFLPSSDSIHFKASATADRYTITKWSPETIVPHVCKK